MTFDSQSIVSSLACGLCLCLGCSGESTAGQAGADAGQGGSSDGAAAGDGPSAGVGGTNSGDCQQRLTGFADALMMPAVCEGDSDCTQYTAPCLQAESGNCAGIFHVTTASVHSIDAAKAAYESCSATTCDAGGACGLGAVAPRCVNGHCR